MAQGWVALLRAVNLGARNKVPMARLRDALEKLGYESVATYIQSGNVVFERGSASDRPRLVRELERVIEGEFGVASTVILRTSAEIRRLSNAHPFGPDTAQSYVAFLTATPSAAAVRALEALDVAPDRFDLRGPDVVLQYPNGVQGSKLTAARLERTLGVAATVRNWRTVARLAEMAP